MVTSSRRSRHSLLASILCLLCGLQVGVSFADDQAGHDAQPVSEQLSSSSAPVLSYISPASVMVGSGGFTLFLSGSNFQATSKVLWNGASRPVTFLSSYQLSSTFSPHDVLCLSDH